MSALDATTALLRAIQVGPSRHNLAKTLIEGGAKWWWPLPATTIRNKGGVVKESKDESGSEEKDETEAKVEDSSDTFIDYSQKYSNRVLDKTDELLWSGMLRNQVTKGAWVVRSVEKVDQDNRTILFKAYGMVPGQDPYYAHLARINFDGSGLTILTEGNGTHSCSFDPESRYLIDTWRRVDAPPAVVLREAQSGRQLVELEHVDLADLLAAKPTWNPPEIFSAPGRDGTTLTHGIIIRPSSFDPSKRYPLDGMGTNWRSKAFHDVCYKNLKDAGFPDRIPRIRAAAATRPWMDFDRVGIYGASAGGQSAVAALLHHGDFYNVAIADSGCHDNRMDKLWWNEAWMGYPVDEAYRELTLEAEPKTPERPRWQTIKTRNTKTKGLQEPIETLERPRGPNI
ncbi:Alpha/Beta hydrolase protein [Cercophora newfieldiana]|uniref:Probable dipeptidyl-aminopeptidase B n=1 Tax=Cercophora newfieldiana TaxID=92897 RepID=A0AA39Y3P6_9PEZI|nr:Alpha/Beta hydrolase protein [Cercophora newfieldiana]